jgi:hypothetical protein
MMFPSLHHYYGFIRPHRPGSFQWVPKFLTRPFFGIVPPISRLSQLQNACTPSYLYPAEGLNSAVTAGGVRLDVVLGSVQDPAAVFDFKTGMAQLTPSRVQQIKQHLPPQSVNIPIYDIWP